MRPIRIELTDVAAAAGKPRLFAPEELASALERQLEQSGEGGEVSLPRQTFGGLRSTDAATLSLVVQVLTSSVAAAAVSGLFALLVERLKARKDERTLRVTIGSNSFEVTGATTEAEVHRYLETILKD